MYVCMDSEYNQYEVEAENMGDALNYLEDGMAVEVVFYDGKAISVELPTSVEREITWTEPAVKGDTSGKVLKPAKIATVLRSGRAAVRLPRRQDRNRHAHGRIPQARLSLAGPVMKKPPHACGGFFSSRAFGAGYLHQPPAWRGARAAGCGISPPSSAGDTATEWP